MGNWDAVRICCEGCGQPELYTQWANDLMLALATNDDLTGHPRMTRLGPPGEL